jgi:VanZ family protein
MVLAVVVAGALPSNYTSWVPAEPAHATVFALLSMCSYVWARQHVSARVSWCVVFVLSLSLVVGSADELRQLLVSGRNGDTRDLAVDCAGTLVGLLIVVPLYRFYLTKIQRE